MTIPQWAEQQLQDSRPAFALAQDRWARCSKRFRMGWGELKVAGWNVGAGADQTRARILAAALECAMCQADSSTPQQTTEARRALAAIDGKISTLADQLATLFRQRTQLEDDYGVVSSVDLEHDPMDLWDALELCFGSVGLGGAEDARRTILQGIAQAQETSQAVPEWEDLLDQLSGRYARHPGRAEGIAGALQEVGTNRTEYSPWCRALLQLLFDQGLLGCLTDASVALLAETAFAAPVGKINAWQIGALRRRMFD